MCGHERSGQEKTCVRVSVVMCVAGAERDAVDEEEEAEMMRKERKVWRIQKKCAR